jgi:uncharacterized protein
LIAVCDNVIDKSPRPIARKQRITMSKDTKSYAYPGATAVITHRVREDKRAEYEEWIDEIAPVSKAAPGHLDWHIVRPIPGLTETYTIILRFDNANHLEQWLTSPTRTRLIDKVRPLLVTGDDFFISSGLDFWFTPQGAKAQVPVRWKQFLVTWSAIFPLVLFVPQLLVPALRRIGVPDNHVLLTLFVSATLVFLMIYIVMPNYTKLVKRWLFT